jgi:hypothetical protein
VTFKISGTRPSVKKHLEVATLAKRKRHKKSSNRRTNEMDTSHRMQKKHKHGIEERDTISHLFRHSRRTPTSVRWGNTQQLSQDPKAHGITTSRGSKALPFSRPRVSHETLAADHEREKLTRFITTTRDCPANFNRRGPSKQDNNTQRTRQSRDLGRGPAVGQKKNRRTK